MSIKKQTTFKIFLCNLIDLKAEIKYGIVFVVMNE